MVPFPDILAAHPLRRKLPYNAIKFARFDQNETPLYTVAKDRKEMGAATALKTAFEQLGAHCFHCGDWMKPQPLSQDCTRDHVRPRSRGGEDYLHNLVFACGPCNRAKGNGDLVSFHPESGAEYLKLLDEHLVQCLESFARAFARTDR